MPDLCLTSRVMLGTILSACASVSPPALTSQGWGETDTDEGLRREPGTQRLAAQHPTAQGQARDPGPCTCGQVLDGATRPAQEQQLQIMKMGISAPHESSRVASGCRVRAAVAPLTRLRGGRSAYSLERQTLDQDPLSKVLSGWLRVATAFYSLILPRARWDPGIRPPGRRWNAWSGTSATLSLT